MKFHRKQQSNCYGMKNSGKRKIGFEAQVILYVISSDMKGKLGYGVVIT